MKELRRIAALLLILALLPLGGMAEDVIRLMARDYPVTRSGWYTGMEEVAVYIAAYQKLPRGESQRVAPFSNLFRDDVSRSGADSGDKNKQVARQGLGRYSSAAVDDKHTAEAQSAAEQLNGGYAVAFKEQRHGKHGQERRAGGYYRGVRGGRQP